MTPEQARTLALSLDVRARELREEIGEDRLADLNAEPEVAALERDVVELREVEAATERMRDGGYGNCADCGVAIPFARLAANPSALRCVACQVRAEKA